jgi:hypothetical protein
MVPYRVLQHIRKLGPKRGKLPALAAAEQASPPAGNDLVEPAPRPSCAPRPAFWLLQVIGWSITSFCGLLIAIRLGFNPMPAVLPIVALRGLIGIVLSTWVLRPWLRLLLARKRPPLLIACHVILSCAGVTLLDQAAVMALTPENILSTQPLELGQLVQSFLPIRLVAYLIWCGGYLTLRQWILRHEYRSRIALAEAAAAKAELAMLRAQVDPHFLFNALNSVLAVADQPERVSSMIQSLCRHMRFSCEPLRLNHTLLDELKAVENYIKIEHFRFEDNLEFKTVVEPSCLRLHVPVGCLLIPVENAVKHGGATSPTPLKIDVTANRQKSRLSLAVSNTGHWRDARPEHNAVGMKNLSDILSRLFGVESSVSISDSDGHVVVTITIPMAKA